MKGFRNGPGQAPVIPVVLQLDTTAGIALAQVPDAIWPDRTYPVADLLSELLDAGRLPRFVSAYAKGLDANGAGNCWEVVSALFGDLHSAGRGKGWRIVEGHVAFDSDKPAYRHVWLECNGWDGWAVDASMRNPIDGARKPVLIMDTRSYRTMAHARVEHIRSNPRWHAVPSNP